MALSNTAQEKRVAIDIGLSSVKFAYFKENLLCLEEFPLFDQPKNIGGLKQQELINLQMTTINKAINLINPKAEFILSPQPSLEVLTRILNHPTEIDLRKYIANEFSFDMDQAGFDTHKIDITSRNKKAKKSEKKTSRAAIAITDIDFIQRSIGLLGEFQLQVKKITPTLVTLLNYLSLTSSGNGNSPIVLLDFGAQYSHLIIYKGMEKFLARTIILGGNQVNQELVQKLNVDFETAERIKTDRKLIDDSLFDSKGISTSMPMFQAINSILFDLVDEIKHSMTYFEDSFLDDLSGSSIILAGAASNLQNLDRFLSKELALPVNRVDNAVHDLASNHKFLPQFVSAIGLLGKPGHTGLLDINLINNIEGLLFKLEDGDYYLTNEGFVNKKNYKKKQKSTPQPSVTRKSISNFQEPALTPIAFFKKLPEKIKKLLKGEKIEMSEMRVSLRPMNMGSIKNRMKHIIVVLGALFLVAYGINRFYWAPKKRTLDRIINNYLAQTAEADKLRASMISGTGEPLAPLTITRTDKILWTDKLKALAAAIPKRVWISDLRITSNTFVISCHVYSYGEDHLKDIALFIKNITTRDVFLRDFNEVKFQSARRSSRDKDIYDFTLIFPLKRKMIEEIAETANKTTS